MNVLSEPWARIRNPLPLPDPLSADVIRDLDTDVFEELVRTHLMPRAQDKAGRALWERFWEELRSDPDLTDRTYDTLEELLQRTQAALNSEELDEQSSTRAQKFAHQCEMAWNRIDRDDRPRRKLPLEWAGATASQHPLHSRHVIASLVSAIAKHRATVLHEVGHPREGDAELWDSLADLGIDPSDH